MDKLTIWIFKKDNGRGYANLRRMNASFPVNCKYVLGHRNTWQSSICGSTHNEYNSTAFERYFSSKDGT